MRQRRPSTSLRGRSVLVTGGTGSFGRSFATRLLELGTTRVRVLSRDEDKQVRMAREHKDIEFVLGDVRDRDRVAWAVKGVDVIFHAAALKHVPHCERHPFEAFQTNVVGSQNLALAAQAAGVDIVVGLSTDKAVKPINAMGTSKAMMEKIFCGSEMRAGPTRFCCTRYGNIMGSRGSVIPLFVSQIESGEELTVTHADMTRFLMDVDESVDLVLFAIENAKGGEIFVKKAPACRTGDLALAVLRAMNATGGVRVVGPRPGEKLHEVLVSEFEMQRAQDAGDFFILAPDDSRADPAQMPPFGSEYTSANTVQIGTVDDIARLLLDRRVIERARAAARASSLKGPPGP